MLDIEDRELAVILDSIPNAVLVLDKSFSVHYANAAAEAMFHTSEASLRKNGLHKVLVTENSLIELIDQVLNKNMPMNEYALDISSPRIGSRILVDAYVAPLKMDVGQVVVMMRQRGVTDRIDHQLSHRGAARSVSGLAAMLAHEIKNPLSGIRGAAQLLEGVVCENDQELTRLITSETDRIVRLVHQMEVFSNDAPLQKGPVNIHSVLGHVRRIAQNGFANHISFIENYDPSLPPAAGDWDELVQLFLNLVKNAAEALEDVEKPAISLSSAYRSGISLKPPGSNESAALTLEFRIEDNGPGIPDEIRSHMFDPFVTTRINGSGLGLALVAKTIERHGGTIEHDNKHTGSTFSILLPAWPVNQKSSKELA